MSKTEETSLSDKIWIAECGCSHINTENIKEFIRKVIYLQMKYFQSTTDGKAVFVNSGSYTDFLNEFKALAGSKLI